MAIVERRVGLISLVGFWKRLSYPIRNTSCSAFTSSFVHASLSKSLVSNLYMYSFRPSMTAWSMIVDSGVELAFVVVSCADIPTSVLEPLVKSIDSLHLLDTII